jgi:four helix bundle protein
LIRISVRDSNECLYWLELLVEAGLVKQAQVADLMKEADEITAIVVSSIQTARGR